MRDAVNDALYDLNAAATTAVHETEQVYVERVKAHGPFDKAAQKEALERTIARTKEIMTDYSYQVIQDATGHANQRIKAKIEEIVGEG